MTKQRITKYVLDDKNEFIFLEYSKDYFKQKYSGSPQIANYKFYNQRKDFEIQIMSHFELDIEQYAKDEYDLIRESEQKEIEDFEDYEIEREWLSRGGQKLESELQNENIINESFIARFITIINRGNDSEIESTLVGLEEKYRIK